MGQFQSVGGSVVDAIRAALREQEVKRRQGLLDGISVEARLREQARMEAEARRMAERQDRADAEHAADRAAAASHAANARGLDQMAADAINMPGFSGDPNQRRDLAATFVREGQDVPSYLADALRPEVTPEPKRHLVTTTGPNGQPVQRLVDESELSGGVPVYREPRAPETPRYTWVLRNGKAMHIQESAIAPGDVPYRPSGGDKPPTQAQSAADAFYARARDANDTVATVEGAVGAWNLMAPSWLQSSNGQVYQQSKRQFIEAYLRKDSGAAISQGEYDTADKTYFPQVGDTAATLQRKQSARQQVLQSLRSQGSATNGNDSGDTSTVVRWGRDANGRPVRLN